MSNLLQPCECHFFSYVLPKFSTYRFPIRSIALSTIVTVFLLGAPSSEIFAQQKSEPKSGQKPAVEIPKKSEENQKLTLRYDIPKFKAGEMGVSKPIVNVEGGEFSYERTNSDSRGGLLFNASTGNIFQNFSDPGKYRITYTLKNLSATTTIIVE